MSIVAGKSLTSPIDSIPKYGSAASSEDIVNFHKLLVKRYGTKIANEVFLHAYNRLKWENVKFKSDQVKYFRKYGIDVNVKGGWEKVELSFSNFFGFLPIKEILIISGVVVFSFYALRYMPLILQYRKPTLIK